MEIWGKSRICTPEEFQALVKLPHHERGCCSDIYCAPPAEIVPTPPKPQWLNPPPIPEWIWERDLFPDHEIWCAVRVHNPCSCKEKT